LLVDIQGKMAEGKSVGYKKWATKFNLKEMSKTLLFLQEQKTISSTILSIVSLIAEDERLFTTRMFALLTPSIATRACWCAPA